MQVSMQSLLRSARALAKVRLSLVVTMLASLSCIPFPHYQHRRPEIFRRVHSEEQPAANLPVSVSSAHVEGDTVRTTTATDGTFHFPLKDEFYFLFWFGDRRDEWKVCVEPPHCEPVRVERAGWWGGPKVEVLSCDLTKREEGFCRDAPSP